MTERPQVLTLTAGARTVHLDTRTVARAVHDAYDAIRASPFYHTAAAELLQAMCDLCGPDHLAAVLRDDGTTTDTE